MQLRRLLTAKTALMGRRVVVAGMAALFPVLGCASDVSSTDADPRGRIVVPPRVGFEIVADALQTHCGTLDCHGHVPRNLRLYGQFGMRLHDEDDPLTEPTNAAEYDATYTSIASLEPEIMSRVASGSAPPVALAMVRKARGIEGHKGGQLQLLGDPLDRCMIGWLIGAPEPDTCDEVVQNRRPHM